VHAVHVSRFCSTTLMLFYEGLNWRVVLGIFGPRPRQRHRAHRRHPSATLRPSLQYLLLRRVTRRRRYIINDYLIWWTSRNQIASYENHTIQKETRIREPLNPHISKWSILQGHVSWCLVISPSLDRQLPFQPLKGMVFCGIQCMVPTCHLQLTWTDIRRTFTTLF